MNRKLERIKFENDPNAMKIRDIKGNVAKWFKIGIALCLILSVFASIGVTTEFAESWDERGVKVVDFFGITFEMEEERLSPFIVFLYANLIFDMGFLLIGFIFSAVATIIQIKLYQLDNTYRTYRLLEVIADEININDEKE